MHVPSIHLEDLFNLQAQKYMAEVTTSRKQAKKVSQWDSIT